MSMELWCRTYLRLAAVLCVAGLFGKVWGGVLDATGLQPGLLMGSAYVLCILIGAWVMWDAIDPFLRREVSEGRKASATEQGISRPQETQ
jgi:ABC-type nickel/cobalt efflux system permease component RcnA